MTWHAVDAEGRHLGTGRPSPAAALAAVPVAAWPVGVTGEAGRGLTFSGALGANGDRVERLLDALARAEDVDVEALVRATPAGTVELPLAVVPLPDGVAATGRVDAAWLTAVDRRRTAFRDALVGAGRVGEMEAALHVSMLLATERLDPPDDSDVDAHVASGARLWLLTGAVVSALAGVEPDPFEPWARLVTAGWWPVGPSGDRLVVSAAGHGR